MTQDNDNPQPEEEWTAEEHTKLMSRYERIAAESAVQPSKDGQSVVAEFSLGGAVPRHEPTRQRFQSKDIYIRLENTIYGPVTQDELAEMLASGELTGFESASADLQHWTPLIYHPKMTLSGETDPDATHGMLHDRSTLPAASRAPDKFDLEALADLDDEEPLPAMPLAAILIKPIKVSKKTGLPIPVHADLEKESIEEVRERTDISEESRVSGAQALVELARASHSKLGDTNEIPPYSEAEGAAIRETESGWDADVAGARAKPASEQMSAMVDAEIQSLYGGVFDEADDSSDVDDWDGDDIEIDEEAAAAMRDVSADEPLPDTDEQTEPAPAPATAPAQSSGSSVGVYMIALLLLAVGAVVVLALMTATTPSAPGAEDSAPPASDEASGAAAVVGDGSGEAEGSAESDGSGNADTAATPSEGSTQSAPAEASGDGAPVEPPKDEETSGSAAPDGSGLAP